MAAETLRGLQMLENAGITSRVTTVVTQANAAVLDRLVLILAGFGCARGIGLDLLVAKGRAESNASAVPADAPTLEKGIERMLSVLADVNQRRRIPIQLREQELIAEKSRNRPVFLGTCWPMPLFTQLTCRSRRRRHGADTFHSSANLNPSRQSSVRQRKHSLGSVDKTPRCRALP